MALEETSRPKPLAGRLSVIARARGWPSRADDPLDLRRALLACAIVTAAAAVAVALIELVDMNNGSVAIMVVSVLLAIAVCGVSAGLIAMALSLPLMWYFILEPQYSWHVDGMPAVASVLVLLAAGGIAVTLYGRERAARDHANTLLRSLRESERHWRDLTESIPALVSETTPRGRFLYVGQRWAAYTGVALDELMTHPLRVCHPDDRARVTEAYTSALKTQRGASAEWRIRSADGAYRWHLGFVAPIRDEAGDIVSWASANIDIDHSKRIGEALRASEERYRELANSVDAIVLIAGADGTFEFANDRFFEYTGCARGALPGDVFGALLHPEDAAAALASWRETVGGAEPRSGEYRLRAADGAYRWHLARVTPIAAHDGGAPTFILTLVNIDTLKDTEEALVESEDRYRTLTNELPALVVSMNAAGEFEYANDSYLEYTGLSPEQAGRWGEFHVVHPDDVERSSERWRRSLATGEPLLNEMRLRRHDGAYRWHVVRGTPLRRRGGTIERWITLSVDVHERKEAEQERERLVRELEQANAAQDEFLGLMSHELKTPITTIAGNAEVLYNRAAMLDEASRLGALHDIRRDAARLHRIIENLLLLARMSRGAELDIEPILVARIVERIVAEHRAQNPLRELILESRGPSLPAIASELYIEQVVRNLLSNAEKYSPAHEPITIEIDRGDGEIVVRVLDRGAGVSPQEASEIFTPFYRSSRTAHYTPGIGIGLAVCRRLIETHGGRIWVRPREGGGAEFGFALPALVDDGHLEDAAEAVAEAPRA